MAFSKNNLAYFPLLQTYILANLEAPFKSKQVLYDRLQVQLNRQSNHSNEALMLILSEFYYVVHECCETANYFVTCHFC